MSSKKQKKTVTNTVTSTNGVHEKNSENPQDLKLAEQQKDTLQTKLNYVRANRRNLPALHFAAKVSDVEVCRHLVEKQGASVNKKYGRSGATPLHFAAMNRPHGDTLIDFFLEKGCKLQIKDARRDRPIDYALKVGNFELAIKLFHLIQNCREPAKQWSLLRFSIRKNYLEFAKFVSKDDVKFCKNPEYDLEILQEAFMYGDLAICMWLLDEVKITARFLGHVWKNKVLCRAAANRYHAGGNIHYLFSKFQFSIVEQRNALVSVFHTKPFIAASAERIMQLLGSNVRFKISGYSWMHYAATNSLDAVEFVHNKDTSLINEITDEGATVLHFAAMKGNVDICTWLIDHGQNLYAVNQNNDGTFLHYAAQNVTNGFWIITKFGPKLLYFVNRIDKYLHTPLHWALVSEYNAIRIARALLSYGADLRVKRNGNNFLHFCIVAGKLRCAKLIHAKNKNMIKQRGEGRKTTLHIAADHFNEEICAWLVSEGADPQEITIGGKTVLESTCSEEAKKFLQSLITTKK
ncbi:poly [ADP-ribose] polymerase tankyrase-1-like [Cloeon dipterum]|uniref:poly [ADP-ribose] polymerase tankyrase-1-like n=1 Tax=Cloeon dipterum TaxID=197152 RepID=UPI00321FE5D6